MKKDPLAEHTLPSRYTEEETTARDAEREATGKYARAKVTREPLDKAIQHREDAADGIVDPWSAPNPMEEVVEAHREPGFAYKFLSPRVCEVLGTRGYETVIDEQGDPVKLGNMFLGKIPERIAEARRQKAAADSVERVKEMQDEYSDAVQRLKRDAQGMGLRVLEPGEIVTANATNERDSLGESRAAGLEIRKG